MSIIYNNQVVAGKYTQQVVADADTVNAGIIKIATEEQINEGTDNTTAVTPFYLAQKQDKIYAGNGIVIDNNEIGCTINPDEQTIVRKNNGTMQCIGQLTKSNTLKFDWEGTQAEYNVAYLNGIIQPDWYCYITDDESIVDYGDVANQSLSNLKQEGEDRFNNKANIDLDNLSSAGQNKLDIKADKATTLEGYGITDGLNKNQTTNCLLEIPQRIKYTLEDGVLTILAGSVVIVPYGVEDLTSQYQKGATFLHENFKVYDTQFADGKFFVWAEVQSDIASNFIWSGTYNNNILYIDILTNIQLYKQNKDSLSGETHPSNTEQHIWYNTGGNVISEYYSDNTIKSSNISLPVLMFNNQASVITSVNQVFNGMGYIGNTVWVDKGVKGLISNGRNIDGSLSNIPFEIDKIETYTVSVSYQDEFAFRYHPQPEYSNVNAYYRMSRRCYSYANFLKDRPTPKVDMWYLVYVKEDNNIWWSASGGDYIKLNACDIFNYDTDDNGNIVKFYPKQVCSLLNKEDSPEISSWSMPSNKYVDLTLGASGTIYTAPANGYVTFGYETSTMDCYVALSGNKLEVSRWQDSNWGAMYLPVNKGQKYRLDYRNLNKRYFRFVYAQGEV